jgi:hypothetical protein
VTYDHLRVDVEFAAAGTLFGHPAARGMVIPVTIGTMCIGTAATEELLTGDLFDAEEDLTPSFNEFGRHAAIRRPR